MSTTRNFGLTPLAFKSGSGTQTAFYKMHKLYLQRASASTLNPSTVAIDQINHKLANSIRHNSNGLVYDRRGERISKMIGLKKTLVNQMQGMVQKPRSKLNVATTNGTGYHIYGKTKLFSSTSSLQGRGTANSSSSAIAKLACASPSAMLHKRFLSVSSGRQHQQLQQQQLQANNSVAQQRYHQFGEMQEKRNGELARDISRAIQSELMDVDANTKRLISCANARQEHTSYDQAGEDHDEQLQHKQQQQKYKKFEGWNHPRAPKPVEVKPTDDLVKQCKPLRRKLTNIRYKDDINEPAKNQLAQPSLQSRKLQAQLGELYASTAKECVSEQRYKPQRNLSSSSNASAQLHNDKLDEDQLMAIPSGARKTLDATENLYKQTHSERDYIERNILKAERDEAGEGAGGAAGRMDKLHYQSKMAANLMSASQRVINKQFEGYRNQLGVDSRNKSKQIMLAKNIVQSVNPTPLTKTITQPPAPKTRLMAASRQAAANNSKYIKSKKHATDAALPHFLPKNMSKKNMGKPVHTKSLTLQKQDKLELEKTMRATSSGPGWNAHNSQQQSKQFSHAKQMQMGERRDDFKQSEDFRANMRNDVPMPTEYTKESAVQRLGKIVEKRASHAFYIQQRARQ